MVRSIPDPNSVPLEWERLVIHPFIASWNCHCRYGCCLYSSLRSTACCFWVASLAASCASWKSLCCRAGSYTVSSMVLIYRKEESILLLIPSWDRWGCSIVPLVGPSVVLQVFPALDHKYWQPAWSRVTMSQAQQPSLKS